jgi:hypothetical protein
MPLSLIIYKKYHRKISYVQGLGPGPKDMRDDNTCLNSDNLPIFVVYIQVYELSPHPSSHNDPGPLTGCSSEIGPDPNLMIDFSRTRI